MSPLLLILLVVPAFAGAGEFNLMGSDIELIDKNFDLEFRAFADKLAAWEALVPEGYEVVEMEIEGQLCYCMVPINGTTTSTTTLAANTCTKHCNKTITVSSGAGSYFDYWATPKYPAEYPENCYCVLTITFETAGYATMTFNDGDKISHSTGCTSDKLEWTGDVDNKNDLCSFLDASASNTLNDLSNNGHSMTATFISSDEDGGVAKGFNMTIQIYAV